MADPSWFVGLVDWWSFGEPLTYDNVPGVFPDWDASHHPGTFQIHPSITGVNATDIMLLGDAGESPPWACAKGGALKAVILPSIITNFDLKGSNPYIVSVPYPGGTPWFVSSAPWSFSIWYKNHSTNHVDASYPVSDLVISTFAGMTLCGDQFANISTRVGWRINIADGSGILTFTDTGGLSVDLGGFADGMWHLATLTWDGAGTYQGYQDGVAVGSPTSGSVFATSADGIHWGYRNVSGAVDIQYAEPWFGEIGDSLLWTRCLSADDVAEFFSGSDCNRSFKIHSDFFVQRATSDL